MCNEPQGRLSYQQKQIIHLVLAVKSWLYLYVLCSSWKKQNDWSQSETTAAHGFSLISSCPLDAKNLLAIWTLLTTSTKLPRKMEHPCYMASYSGYSSQVGWHVMKKQTPHFKDLQLWVANVLRMQCTQWTLELDEITWTFRAKIIQRSALESLL